MFQMNLSTSRNVRCNAFGYYIIVKVVSAIAKAGFTGTNLDIGYFEFKGSWADDLLS
jgi:hypothetical protein